MTLPGDNGPSPIRSTRASFLAYWKPFVPEPLSCELVCAGSKYYLTCGVKPGDAVWIVTAEGPQLLLCGPIEVGWIGGREEAVARVKNDNLFDLPCWVVAREGTAQLIQRIDITPHVPELSFETKTGTTTMNVGEGVTFGQSLQRVRKLTPASAQLLARIWRETALSSSGPARPPEWQAQARREAFEPRSAAEARAFREALIAIREGQPAFRSALVGAYEGRCAITGCDAVEALEAAHVTPYRAEGTSVVENGLLLRADVHTLFDRNLLAVDTTTSPWLVVVAPALRKTVYGELHGVPLRLPTDPRLRPSESALAEHRRQAGLQGLAPPASAP